MKDKLKAVAPGLIYVMWFHVGFNGAASIVGGALVLLGKIEASSPDYMIQTLLGFLILERLYQYVD